MSSRHHSHSKCMYTNGPQYNSRSSRVGAAPVISPFVDIRVAALLRARSRQLKRPEARAARRAGVDT
eukprot:scaffold2006_cov141-Isochrysis_galbana.AAC.7